MQAPATADAEAVAARQAPRDVLGEVFGFGSFRPLQEEVIDRVLARRDTLVVLPTGGGKSLCYQLPALLFDGLTVVVSPLISLMQDQARQLEALGIPAALLNSSLDGEAYLENTNAVRSGHARLLYLAPETLLLDRTLALLRSVRVSCLAVDEAHCISEWGYDFRPEYRRIAEIRGRLSQAVCLALTATATPRVREDIQRTLGFEEEGCFLGSFDRPNLVLRAEDREEPLSQLRAHLARLEGESGIVYCTTRKRVEEVAAHLQRRGLSARPYHAGHGAEERRETQERFLRDDVGVIVATVAFGMGIDKPDVRFIVHLDLPPNLESYYQQIGRAGRDGLPAECLLLHGAGDVAKIEYFISQKSDEEQRVARLQLGRMQAFVETTLCRRRPLLEYFGEAWSAGSCGACDNCLEPPPDLQDLTVEAQKLLSCAFRTGQRFGASHLVQVLRGSRSQKVLQRGHDRLTTYGIGKEHDAAQWRHLARQLLQQGLLDQDPEHGSLRLTASARPVLQGRAAFEGRLRRPVTKAHRRRAEAAPDLSYDEGLFEELRRLRKDLADAECVPPYVVFSDRTLLELAGHLPRSERSLLHIHGLGKVKVRRYGTRLLQLLDSWCEERGIPAPPEEPEGEPASSGPHEREGSLVGVRCRRIATALAEAGSLEELARREGIKPDTVVGHLERWVAAGEELDPDDLRRAIDTDDRDLAEAETAFEALGSRRLRPIYERLEGRIPYPTLRLARLLHHLDG